MSESRLIRPALAPLGRPQLTVLGGQLAAGAGNLLFAVAMVRLLEPGDYASVVTFLALYLLLHVAGTALSASGALAPEHVAPQTERVRNVGFAVGAFVVCASPMLAPLLGLEVAMVVALGLAAPAAGLLGLHRGLAYGDQCHGRVTASLVAEPAVRLVSGLALAWLAGPIGAALAVVLAGYGALTVLIVDRRRVATPWPPPMPPVRARAVAAVGVAFVLLAGLQSIDLLVANRVLDADAAGRFAVLSTIGGAAYFATATIPLVLMPAVRRGRPDASSSALAFTTGLGVGIAVAGGVLARPLVERMFGPQYTDIAHLVGPYLLAMALLGIIRVQAARRSAQGSSSTVTTAVAIGAAVVVELLAVWLWADSVDAVVAVTLFTTAGLTVVLEFPHVVRQRTLVWPQVDRRTVVAIVGLCAVATAARVATSRGLWVDEAISVNQAQMSFGDMLADMRTTDVHPPLHHAILWITVRLFGTSEFAVRLPSLIAGVALVPAMAWVGRIVYDRRTGWMAAMFAAIAPFCVWYSQEARMYAQFMVLAAVAIGAQVQAIRRGRTFDWALYGVATALMVWTQYFAVLPILVQQVAFAWVLWRDRGDRARRRDLLRGWFLAVAIVVVIVAPLLPTLRAQLDAYGARGAGLVPGQAGAGSSAIGGTISIYAIGANLIWALLGYHADDAMAQIAAFWPLLMLVGLVLLGRGRSGNSLLLLGLVVAPMAALFAVGSMKRDLFELRYFSGAVPAMLLLGARLVTATAVRRAAVAVAGAAAAAVMLIGLVDQQLNGANPRLYDFEGALERVSERAEKGDVVLYEPAYLGDVVQYYAPELRARPVGTDVALDGAVWVLATERVIDAEDTSARLGTELAGLERDRTIVDRFERPNVRVWELR